MFVHNACGMSYEVYGAMGCLRFVIDVFPDHTHLLFMKFLMGKG